MDKGFLDYYRCPDRYADFALSGGATPDLRADLPDVLADVRLPFDSTEVAETLRLERYVPYSHNGHGKPPQERSLWNAYRLLRPILPVSVRKHLHRFYMRGWDRLSFPRWPVDTTVDHIFERRLALVLRARGVDRVPFVWFWPEGAPACAVVTHDVETLAGRNFCSSLMDLDDSFGVKSSFQIVPERRYPVTTSFLAGLRRRGFEINVHDLDHDGQLFASRSEFLRRAKRINDYGKEFGAVGFRSGNLYRNQQWFEALDFSYDMSVPNVAHLDPQRGGCCTVLPFFIGDVLELPLTTTQDYSLFHVLNDYSLDLWKRQIALVTEQHGLASFIVHPDYVVDRRARHTYQALLAHLAQLRADGALWIPLPREVDRWWRERSEMTVVADGPGWRIEGKGSERARLAFASLEGDKLTFTVDGRRLR